ncbi:MAG TPA: hypothetical protein VGS19_23995, partial [Streptosporangiaceae bacterium]|nr:hypothetical protein [Streptosporangiaceae bacterium]
AACWKDWAVAHRDAARLAADRHHRLAGRTRAHRALGHQAHQDGPRSGQDVAALAAAAGPCLWRSGCKDCCPGAARDVAHHATLAQVCWGGRQSRRDVARPCRQTQDAGWVRLGAVRGHQGRDARQDEGRLPVPAAWTEQAALPGA